MPVFKDVVEKTREFVLTAQADNYIADYSTCAAIGQQLEVELRWDDTRGQYDWDSFCGQVGRALEKLAKDGVLIKVGAGQPGPGGHQRSYNRYYLPAKHAALTEAHSAAMAEVRADRERWQKITADLERYFGVKIGTTGHRPVLTADQFEHIIDELGAK